MQIWFWKSDEEYERVYKFKLLNERLYWLISTRSLVKLGVSDNIVRYLKIRNKILLNSKIFYHQPFTAVHTSGTTLPSFLIENYLQVSGL